MRPRYAGLGRGGFGDNHNSPPDVLGFRFCPVDALGCAAQAFLEAAMLDDIADRIDVAVLENVSHAKLQRIEAQPLGDHVRLRLDSPISFRDTHPPQLGAANLVGKDEGRSNSDIGNPVRADAVLHGAVTWRQSLGIGAGIPYEVDVPGYERAILFDPGFQLDNSGRRPGGCGELLGPRHDNFDRLASLERQRHGTRFQARIDLATEPSANLRADHPHFALRHSEGLRQDRPKEKDFLGTTPNGDGAGLTVGHDRVRFHITVMNLARPEGILKNIVGSLERGFDITPLVGRLVYNVGPFDRIPRGQVNLTAAVIGHLLMNQRSANYS